MIVTFCGHSDFKDNGSYTQIMLDFLEKTVGDCSAEMYLGGYGGFDAFACKCCKKYKENHSDISLIFVSPYVISERQKNLYSSYDHLYIRGLRIFLQNSQYCTVTDIWLKRPIVLLLI